MGILGNEQRHSAVFHTIKGLNTNKITLGFFSFSAVIILQNSLLQATVKAMNLAGFKKKIKKLPGDLENPFILDRIVSAILEGINQ